MTSRARASRTIGLSLCVWLAAPVAWGEPPAPIDPTLFSFPGAVENPASARSAGVALADQWLGDDPFSNPAALGRNEVQLSPNLVRASRQDLRADNRNYDEQAGFFDGAGAAIGTAKVPWGGALWLYAFQPVLRLEDFAFNRGTGNDPSVIPAALSAHAETREAREGLAASWPIGRLRAGAGVELTQRRDSYQTIENSGAPDNGKRRVQFDDDGVGFQVGVRYETPVRGLPTTIGAAARSVPSLDLQGTQQFELLSGSSTAEVASERKSAWEGGISVRCTVVPALQVLAAAGGRGRQEWPAFGVESGRLFRWGAGFEYREPETPLALRFGVALESQSRVPESRASLVGLGVAYDWDGTWVEVGALHRSVERPSSPKSSDDRVVASLKVSF